MTQVTFWKLVNKPFSVAYVISLLDMAKIPRFLVRFIILFQQRQAGNEDLEMLQLVRLCTVYLNI